MPTDCVWHDTPPEGGWPVGACFYSPYEHQMSKHYEANVRAARRPIMVVLPMRGATQPWHATTFVIDSHPTNDENAAWGVEVVMASLVDGQKPDITVTPSIDCRGLYHGYLTHGVISDDL